MQKVTSSWFFLSTLNYIYITISVNFMQLGVIVLDELTICTCGVVSMNKLKSVFWDVTLCSGA